MIKILFLDYNNTALSAMAEIMLKEKISDSPQKISVTSAGIQAVNGISLQGETLKALWLRGFDGDGFTTTAYSEESFNDADYVIIFNKQIKFLLPKSKKVYTLGELVDGKDLKEPSAEEFVTYLDVASDLDGYIDVLLEKLKEQEKI